MTNRTTHIRFGWLLAFSFLFTFIAGSGSAADLADATQVALRPGSSSMPPASTPTDWNNPGFPTDLLRPDLLHGPPTTPPANDRQNEIGRRYQDSRMLGFLQTTNMNQIASLYAEASRMIDSRHVSPVSYEERTRAGLGGLVEALNNPAFLQAAGYRSAANTQALQNELMQLANSPARSANDAVGLMQYAAELANRRLGLRREAVALEFFNASLDSLDKYSAFVPARTGRRPGAGLEEQMVGIGVELKKHDSGALINDVVPNSPASEGRLQRGDVIVGVNNQNTYGMTLDQVAGLIGGPSGSSVSLRINRNGGEYTVSMRRRSVYVGSVMGGEMISGGVGYVRLKQFSESSKEDLEKAMWSLHRQGMRSLVLDLRGNPGGLLDESIDICNLFLPSGRIVATRGRNASDNMDESATWSRTWSTPLVVLVDGDSASASEIFAAAVQENGRGVIVGRKTYGKGTVQTHFPLRTVSGELKLTTAKFYSPRGREMAGAGVAPDFAVNVGSEFYNGPLTGDPDVTAALQLIENGAAAQLATAAGQRRN